MADTYGALAIPAAATTPAGDPALQKIGDYLQAVCNVKLLTAWSAIRPRSLAADQLPIRTVVVTNPEEEGFNDKDLPALYLWREDGDFQQRGSDIRNDESHIKILWVLPSDKQAHQQLRKPAFNAISKTIDDALERGRDPNWADAGDSEWTAASVAADTDSIKLSAATTMGALVFSGAALNGVRGNAAFAPAGLRLAPTITTSVTLTDTYNTTDPTTWTFVDWYGRTRTLTKLLTLVRGGETLTVQEDVAEIVSIAQPAHLSTAGAIQYGTAAFTGRGSVLIDRAGFTRLDTGKWNRAKVQIEVLGGEHGETVERRLSYHALQMILTVLEERTVDIADATRFHPTAGDLDTTKVTDGEDDLLVASRTLP